MYITHKKLAPPGGVICAKEFMVSRKRLVFDPLAFSAFKPKCLVKSQLDPFLLTPSVR